jgi:spore photoproduct lyase
MIRDRLVQAGVPVTVIPSRGPIPFPSRDWRDMKGFLLVAVRQRGPLQSCRPSADYQLPLVSGCPGLCEYCYLHTRFGQRSYTTVYANVEEILSWTMDYRTKETVVFEGSATSDPVPVNEWTSSLEEAITFFARQEGMRFRFATKFHEVDLLLPLDHGQQTEIRFSVNTPAIIRQYERGTPSLAKRLAAARRIREAGYPSGFLIAPILAYPAWKEDYRRLVNTIAETVTSQGDNITFELISHRYTARAKEMILSLNPESTLPMVDEERQFKYGQFGYGKYVYPQTLREALKGFLTEAIQEAMPKAKILYFV